MYRLFLIVIIPLIVFFSSSQVFAQEPRLATFQETAQLIIDKSISNNVTVAISLQSTSNQEIRIPTELVQKIQDNNRVRSVVITSEEQCVLGVQPDKSCVMINMSVEGIPGGIKAIQDMGRLIGDSLINDINEAFDTNGKFHSVFLHHRDESNRALETSGIISGQGTFSAVYTMPKEDSHTMYEKFSVILLPKEIRELGGFYEIASKLSKEQQSRTTLSIITQNASSLFQLKLSVDYPNSATEISNISPLEFFKINELKRSDYFSGNFYPLNSLLKIIILSSEPLKVSDMKTKIVPDVIIDGERFPEFTTDGWFFDKESGEKIEATYLFGKKFSVSKGELVFAVIPINSTASSKINMPSDPSEIDTFQIIILVGIVIVSILASIYYMKGFRTKTLDK